MATVSTVLQTLERIAPSRYAFSFDKIGLQVGDPHAPVTRAVVSLDRSLGAVSFGAEAGAELLLSHHPLLFEPAKSITAQTHVGRTSLALIRAGMNFIAAHTNWDSARGGVNDALCSLLGIEAVSDFGSSAEISQLKLTVYCPAADVERIIDAAAAAGAGQIGLYSRCAFLGEGTGTFKGEEGSNPTIGTVGQIEKTPEHRIEMVLPAERRIAVEKAVRAAHSYEEAALDFFVLTPNPEQPAGRIGTINPLSLRDFATQVEARLGGPTWTWGDPESRIRKVAVVGGAADGEWVAAQRAGADVFVTGEVRQHIALEASESGMPIIAAGHYATEQPGVIALRDRMAEAMPEVDWLLFTPVQGLAGRPL